MGILGGSPKVDKHQLLLKGGFAAGNKSGKDGDMHVQSARGVLGCALLHTVSRYL